MVGYIPDPKKSTLDYLGKPKSAFLRILLGLFKISVGLLTLCIIPLSLCVYFILMVAARKFFISDIPRMCEDVVLYSFRLIKTGWQDVVHKFYVMDD